MTFMAPGMCWERGYQWCLCADSSQPHLLRKLIHNRGSPPPTGHVMGILAPMGWLTLDSGFHKNSLLLHRRHHPAEIREPLLYSPLLSGIPDSSI